MRSFLTRLTVLILCGVYVLAGLSSGVSGAEAESSADRRYVFAHYMTCFFNSKDFYKQEIELAQRHGIDGFALNCGSWFGNKNYIEASERMYQAAKELDTDFQLMFSVDWLGIRNFERDMYDMVERFYEHPNQFRHDGKVVISTYGGRPARFRGVFDKFEENGLEVFFVPNLSQQRFSANRSLESNLRLLESEPFADGLFWFGPDATVAEALRTNATMRRATLFRDKIHMAGVSPSYNSPNLRDHYGVEGYGAVWRGIIRDGSDWVEIVTWSDYNEDSHLHPYRWSWPRNTDRQYNDHDESYLNATDYYAKWYKSGRRPRILQDRVIYAYRNRSHRLRRAWDHKEEKWVDLTMTDWPFDQVHDDVEDVIYVSTFLTAPARLTIELAGESHGFDQPAGVTHARVPLAGGVPEFSLQRDGDELLTFSGRKRIITRETQTKLNSAKGYHLLNRTWTGAGVVGETVATLQAEAGELTGDARFVKVGGDAGVRNEEQDGSGFQLPVNGLETATYNIRVRYSNASDAEARLTMMADGAPGGSEKAPYYIPLFLPPTGEDRTRTVSFLWSLYEDTSWLRVHWLETNGKGRSKGHPLNDDLGTPVIDRIELVRVEPFETPERRDSVLPEMVRIPGGSFTMGAADGRPDEKPAHQVTLSPFAISKYEITNELYEKFNPDHARHRDGYSWRNREPVIYVSWIQGAKYCNWLSEQAGLTPAYWQEDEKKRWVVDTEADGFRMPTEAEWEYVAGGRDEERRYPWGDEDPRPGHHGRFQLKESLDPDPDLPSQYEAGTMVVGSYPAGASRDGVMDLAGNVCEWTSDWFQPYSDEAAGDPLVQESSNYRTIRGSSWGYYGYPVEVHDREYNNPKYPGYVYIGLRVVLPEAGWEKVRKSRMRNEE